MLRFDWISVSHRSRKKDVLLTLLMGHSPDAGTPLANAFICKSVGPGWFSMRDQDAPDQHGRKLGGNKPQAGQLKPRRRYLLSQRHNGWMPRKDSNLD
jgi:hypothetical protein